MTGLCAIGSLKWIGNEARVKSEFRFSLIKSRGKAVKSAYVSGTTANVWFMLTSEIPWEYCMLW